MQGKKWLGISKAFISLATPKSPTSFITSIANSCVNPLFDLAMAIRIIRNNAEEWFIDEDKIVLCGFSAGGNLVANMGVKWHEKFISEKY